MLPFLVWNLFFTPVNREYRIMSNKDEIATILGDKWKHVQCIGMARLKRKTEND